MIEELKTYPEYMPSNHVWLGDVPKHWSLKPNRALFAEVKDRNHPDDQMLSVTITKGIVRQKTLLENTSKKDSSNLDRSAYKLVRPDDIAYNKMRAWQGAIGASPLRGIVSPAYVVMRLRDRDDLAAYFHYLFRTPQFAKEAERWSYGITSDMWSLRPEHFRMIYSPKPSMAEQAAIVRFLNWAQIRLERAIGAKRKVIGLLNEQKNAIIHRAVTRGIDPSSPLKPSGVSWLGDIPQHWEVKKLRFLFRYAKGSRGAELTNEYIGQNAGAFPVYSGQTERGGLMGSINWYEFDFPSQVVFVSTVGARAMTTRLIQGKFNLSQNCALIIPRSEDLDPVFFYYVFQRLFAYERASISLIMQPSLRFADLNRFYVPHPSHHEQLSIVRMLSQEIETHDIAISRLEGEIELLAEYRVRLIADVVTGKLDVQEMAARLPREAAAAGLGDQADLQSNVWVGDEEVVV